MRFSSYFSVAALASVFALACGASVPRTYSVAVPVALSSDWTKSAVATAEEQPLIVTYSVPKGELSSAATVRLLRSDASKGAKLVEAVRVYAAKHYGPGARLSVDMLMADVADQRAGFMVTNDSDQYCGMVAALRVKETGEILIFDAKFGAGDEDRMDTVTNILDSLVIVPAAPEVIAQSNASYKAAAAASAKARSAPKQHSFFQKADNQ